MNKYMDISSNNSSQIGWPPSRYIFVSSQHVSDAFNLYLMCCFSTLIFSYSFCIFSVVRVQVLQVQPFFID